MPQRDTDGGRLRPFSRGDVGCFLRIASRRGRFGKIAPVRIGVVLVDTGMSDDAVLVQAYLGVNGYPPLRVFEPEPRFLYGDGNACDGLSVKTFIFLDERRRVEALHSVDLGNHFEHCVTGFGVGFHNVTPYPCY